MVNFNPAWCMLQGLLVGQLLFNPLNALAIDKVTSTTMTTSAKASTTCSMVAKTPLPTGHYCGVQGRLKSGLAKMKTYKGKNTNSCLEHCLHVAGCHAFSIDLTANDCYLYNSSISSNNFKASSTNQFFYNPKCFTKSCGTVNSTSSAGKSSTITSAPSGSSTSGTMTSSASVPVTTIKKPGQDCIVPLPLNVRDCQLIQQELQGASIDYKLYYNGTEVVENANNVGNQNAALPSFTVIMKGEMAGCDAATECAQAGTSLGLASIYHSFDLHYRLSECAWECVVYGGYNNLTSAFNVQDSDAFRTHGYTGKMKMVGSTGDYE